MIIKRPEKSAHWYKRNGIPFYTVPKADGSGERTTTIRDAFKEGAYRSVTNVIGILAKPGLEYWKNEQLVLSALTLPRVPNETDHEFAERVMVDADEQAKNARNKGVVLHDAAGNWLQYGTPPSNPEVPPGQFTPAELLKPFQDWCAENLFPDRGLVMPPESVMLNHQHAYAGRVDLPVRLVDGSIAIIDLKTTEVARDKKDVSKPSFYDEWALQLAAYSRCIFADGSYPPPMPWRLISGVIDTSRPGFFPKEWTDPANPLPSSEPHFQAFLNACRVWSYLKGGTPGIDKAAA